MYAKSLILTTSRACTMHVSRGRVTFYAKQNTPSTSTIYAGTRQNLRSHASTPRISKLHAEDLRRDIHRFHPGPCFLHFVRQQNLRRRQLAASKAFDEYYNPMRITIRPEKKGRNVDIRLDKNLTSLCSAVLTAFLFAQIRLFHG